jgi:pyridoxal phosphate enzyme (YggS family)
MSIAQNLAVIQERIARAAGRAGRAPGEVQLMAVSKTFSPEAICEAYAAGQRLFGENRVQEFAAKISRLSQLGLYSAASGATWHFIGHLQSNKSAKAVEVFDAVDSLDSLRLAERLNAAARQRGRTLPVLIELNLGGEQSKTGLSPDSPEVEEILQAAPRLDRLQITGLMTVPPYTEDPEDARPYFRRLRQIRDSIAARNLPGVHMDQLSMGMSHDFEVAIEEGSTCVRLGTAIFGRRQPSQPGVHTSQEG